MFPLRERPPQKGTSIWVIVSANDGLSNRVYRLCKCILVLLSTVLLSPVLLFADLKSCLAFTAVVPDSILDTRYNIRPSIAFLNLIQSPHERNCF
jgi:hypothetical protein